jgi:hypothetical protein
MEGLLTKAYALGWCRQDDEFEPEDYESTSTETHIVYSIANDLMLMRRYVA